MKKQNSLLLLAGFLVFANLSFAQQLKFNLVLDNTTFSFGYNLVITQDPKGYIWFASTPKGLHRFDGKTITDYKHNIDNANSLASNEVTAVSADSAGNIWVGMFGFGLDRFQPETKQFTHFRHIPGDPKSLGNDTVSVITTDRSGNTWIGTIRGVDMFNPEKGTFTHYAIQELAGQTSSFDNMAIVSVLYEDRKGNIWIGWAGAVSNIEGLGGLARLEKSTGKLIQYKHNPSDPKSLANNNVFAIYEDSRGNLWVGTGGNGLQILDRKNGSFSNYPYDASHPEKPGSPPVTGSTYDVTSFITEDSKGRLWIGSSAGGINMYDPVLRKTTHFGLVSNDKINRFSKDTAAGFADSTSIMALTSKDGLLWIVSRYKGIYNIDFSSTTVPYVPLNASAASFFYEEEQNRLWIHSDSGIIRRNVLTNEQKIFRYDPKNPSSLSGGDAFHMLGDGEGNIWVANHNTGIAKFNIKTEQVTHYRHDKNNPASLVNDSTHVLFFDHRHYLWIGTHIGLSRMDTKTGNCTNYIHNPKDSFSIGNSHVNSLAQDKKERLWIGTDNDMYSLDINTGKFQRYEISNGQILNICPDASGKIWATCGGALFLLDEANKRFKKFTTQVYPDGFENIWGMVEDGNGNLWLSCNKSIVKINKERDAAAIFGAAQGVLPTTDIWMKNIRTVDGLLFLGSKKGYYSFAPDELKDERTAPILNFSNFKIGNREIVEGKGSVLTAPVWKTTSINLSYKQNTFTFEFGAVAYKSHGDIKYLYKLENYDDEWRDAGTETKATFFNLPPGKYVLQVKAVSSDGSFAEKSMAITITPPWWKSWWAYWLYGIFILLAGYLVYKYQRAFILKRERERTQQKELAQAKEIEKAYRELKATQAQLIQSEKMASLGELTAGIAHEIQNPLNFVNNFSELNKELAEELKQELASGNWQQATDIADNIIANEEKINHHGKRADGIVKGMLQHSRSSNGQKEPTDLNALCDEYLRLAYHGLRAKDKSFNAKFETALDPSLGMVSVHAQDIGRVILNLINNAFYAVSERKKEEGGGYEPTVRVITRKVEDKVEIKIIDNGTGIPQKVIDKIFQPFFTTKPTGEGTGLGLSLSYDIVTKGHGGELRVETKEGEGTTFTIKL